MRRLGSLVALAALAVGGVLVWPASVVGGAESDASDVTVTRYGGADRYATSLLIAEAVAADAGGSLGSVVLVSGERWTDAVVAAPIAGAAGTAVLMTPPDELRADALEFLDRVGVSRAVVVGPDGGGGAHGSGRGVNATVLAELAHVGVAVSRVAGADRYSTSVAAAQEVTPGQLPGLGRTAIVASADVFADALVAGPIAARGIHPVLLSAPDSLPASVAEYLGTAGISHVLLMGGRAALGADVETTIRDLRVSMTRLAGKSRFDTAVKAAEFVDGRYSDVAGDRCFAADTIGVARARVPFDSFSAAPLLGRLCASLVLADPKQIPADTAAFLDRTQQANAKVDLRVFGGDAAVSQAAIDTYLADTDGSDERSQAGDDDDAVPTGLASGTCGGSADDKSRKLFDSNEAEDPAWSPDCSKVAYSHGGALWTMNNDGTGRRALVAYDGAFADDPAWSPDGSQIAYARSRRDDDGHLLSHIYIVNADGTAKTKFSKGDVQDRKPTWSPDGDHIAFERRSGDARSPDGSFADPTQHIAVQNTDRTNLTTLTTGDSWHGSPAWSPTGNRIAYVSQGAVWLVDPDGTNATNVIVEAFSDGGLSWSPGGRRIAFVRGDWPETSIIIADLDSSKEKTVSRLDGLNVMPRWSPDGDRIAFTRYRNGRDPTNRSVYVTGASGPPTGLGTGCRPRGIEIHTAGFPLPKWAIPSTGVLRVAVLFMDFPDAQAAVSPQDEAAEGLQLAEEYMEAVSYGLLDVEFVPHYHWLRADRSYRELLGVNQVLGETLGREAGALAVRMADPDFDFADFDAVITVFPRSHFTAALGGWTVTADGNNMRNPYINFQPVDGQPHRNDPRQWGHTAAHELVHGLGLVDYYPYDPNAHDTEGPIPAGKSRVETRWGLMGMVSWYIADSADPELEYIWHHPEGHTFTSYSTSLQPHEMLAWSRWQLGWLDESEVRCLNSSEATVSLAPIAQPKGGIAMTAVPLNSREVIVVESRRDLGFDSADESTNRHGWTTDLPRLAVEGVLVYTVDSLLGSGELPLKIAGDSGDGQVDDFPVLQVGESVRVRGYTITVTADDGDTHTVSIERDG